MEKVTIFHDVFNDRYLQWIDVYTKELGWTDIIAQASHFQEADIERYQSTISLWAYRNKEEVWVEAKVIYVTSQD